MVAVFLTAEGTSDRYGPQIREILARLGQPPGIADIEIPAMRPPTRYGGRSWPPTAVIRPATCSPACPPT
jgi:hypothetical protein